MNDTLARLWERTYDLRSVPLQIANLTTILSDLDQLDPSDLDASLLRAYLAYHFPCELTDRIDTEAELKRVLAADESNTTARIYLAHVYFDGCRFQESLDHLRKIDIKEYESIGQIWRSLKIEELIISAKIHISPQTVSMEEILVFADRLKIAGTENAALPTELINALQENKSTLISLWTPTDFEKLVRALRAS